jgi:hypothetical protein
MRQPDLLGNASQIRASVGATIAKTNNDDPFVSKVLGTLKLVSLCDKTGSP